MCGPCSILVKKTPVTVLFNFMQIKELEKQLAEAEQASRKEAKQVSQQEVVETASETAVNKLEVHTCTCT